MDYLSWNDALAAHFFGPAREGARVWLEVTEELIAEIGKGSQVDVRDFVAAVKVGPPWAKSSGVCQRALETCKGWRSRNLRFPPYIGFLALFSLAAGIEAEAAVHAYYPRLRKLLGDDAAGPPRAFDQMLELWGDLEKWSIKDNYGRFGEFLVDFASNWIHVGLPVAQTLLTAAERHDLPGVFAECGFDSESPPSDEDLVRAMLGPGRRVLRSRTLRILSGEVKDEDLRNILISRIQEELRNWEGVVEEAVEGTTLGTIAGSIRLCIDRLDRVAGSILVGLRCYSNFELPEEGLSLSPGDSHSVFQCNEQNLGWTELLRVGNRPFDLGDFRILLSGMKLTEAASRWKFRLPSDPVRILVEASSIGLRGYIEERKPPVDKGFLLLVHESRTSQIEEWGPTGCRGFRRIEINSGLPGNWRLYEISSLLSDKGISESCPNLSVGGDIPLQLIGGLRLGKGNAFFKFAPPALRISSSVEQIEVSPDSIRLKKQAGDIHRIEGELAQDTLISIRVTTKAGQSSQRNFVLVDNFDLIAANDAACFGRFGERISPNQTPNSSGAHFKGCEETNLQFSLPDAGDDRVLYLGRAPGLVARSPVLVSLEWEPIWAIQLHGRTATALFCGNLETDCAPIREPSGNKEAVSEWRDFLWGRRKRIAAPQHPKLRSLWKLYVETARDV